MTPGIELAQRIEQAQILVIPLLGEHTDVLLESLCGVEPDEAKRLRQEGVV
jgi:hypothetical protein